MIVHTYIPCASCIRIMFIVVIMHLMSSTASSSEEVRTYQQLPENEKIVDMNLYSEMKLMGPGDPVRVSEGQVTVGRWYVQRVLADSIKVARDRDIYVARMSFSPNVLPEHRYYENITYEVELQDPNIVAFELFPKNQDRTAHVTDENNVSPSISYKGVDLKGVDLKRTISYERLDPTLAAFGIGQNRFSWVLSGLEDQPVSPGAREVVALLDVPHKQTTVIARIKCVATISYSGLSGIFKRKYTISEPYMIEYKLGEALVHRKSSYGHDFMHMQKLVK